MSALLCETEGQALRAETLFLDNLTIALCISIGSGVPWLIAIYSDNGARQLLWNSIFAMVGIAVGAGAFNWISPRYSLIALIFVGPVVVILTIAAGYWASLQPSIYPVANFWLSSPTFFFIRLGIAITLVPIAWVLEKHVKPLGFLETFGRSSLFVYWIHVEMVYGVIAKPLERLLPVEVSILGTVALCALLLAIVRWKNRVIRDLELTGPLRIFAPVLR